METESRIGEYLDYHAEMLRVGDMDPAIPALRYVCDRFELNVEQRYWLAWLYASCYCGATTFYLYNEFPDFENVDVGRLRNWWARNKQRTVFQTDRLWVRSRDQFPPMFESYRSLIGRSSQRAFFGALLAPDPTQTYDEVFRVCSGLYQFGRFSLFLYLDAMNSLTGLPMSPTGLDLAESESSRNGLCYAFGLDHLITGKETGRRTVSARELALLAERFAELMPLATERDARSNVWNVETSLCAFKKFKRGQRWIGYYLDRQAKEIEQLQERVPEGVDWSVLWDFRAETIGAEHLRESSASAGNRRRASPR